MAYEKLETESPFGRSVRNYIEGIRNKGQYGISGMGFYFEKEGRRYYAPYEKARLPVEKIQKNKPSNTPSQTNPYLQQFPPSHPNPYPPSPGGLPAATGVTPPPYMPIPTYAIAGGAGTIATHSYTAAAGMFIDPGFPVSYESNANPIKCHLCNGEDFSFIAEKDKSTYAYGMYCCDCGAKHKNMMVVLVDNGPDAYP